MLCLGAGSVVDISAPAFRSAPMPVSEMLDVSGRIAIATSGFMFVAGAIATFAVCIKRNRLFSAEKQHWLCSTWQARETLYSAGILAFAPFVVSMLWALIRFGKLDRWPPNVAMDRMISPLWLQATVLITVAVPVICVLTMQGWFYSRIAIDRVSREVYFRRRRWPFRARTKPCGLAQALTVLPTAELLGRDFLDPAENAGWLILQTSDDIVPMVAMFSTGEMIVFQWIAEIWNQQLELVRTAATGTGPV